VRKPSVTVSGVVCTERRTDASIAKHTPGLSGSVTSPPQCLHEPEVDPMPTLAVLPTTQGFKVLKGETLKLRNQLIWT